MDAVDQYLLFLAETVTLLVVFVVAVAAIAVLGLRQRQDPEEGHLSVRHLNDQLDDLVDAIDGAVLEAKDMRRRRRARRKDRRREQRSARPARPAGADDSHPDVEGRPRVYVLDFVGDLEAEPVSALRHEVSAVLGAAREGDEVVLRLESGGGMVHAYGFAASQLMRLKAAGVRLVVVVDRIAASGGYLMACIADELIAAPFAIVGSIGVVVELPNVNRLLKRHDIDVEVLTAGRHKRTLSTLGPNTDEGRRKLREEIDDIHGLFKEFVSARRPALDVERVATGEAWHGTRALDLKLVDRLATSDEYLLSRADEADLLEVRWEPAESRLERLLKRLPLHVARRARLPGSALAA
jgi:serine protease SohB